MFLKKHQEFGRNFNFFLTSGAQEGAKGAKVAFQISGECCVFIAALFNFETSSKLILS